MKMPIYLILLLSFISLSYPGLGQAVQKKKIDLSGTWSFAIDSLDKGIREKWYNRILSESIRLPGSMTANGKGNDV
jgi:beta-galactosidase/beta-glucuronidase